MSFFFYMSEVAWVYSFNVLFCVLQEENLLDILSLSHRFGFVELESSISDYLKAILNIRNVCHIYDLANIYSLSSLCNVCKDYMDRNAQEVLTCESFLSLSQVKYVFEWEIILNLILKYHWI